MSSGARNSLIRGGLIWLLFTSAASGHEPLFMPSHQAPGKGALDTHLEVDGASTELADETVYEVEASWGVTRDLAFRLGLPQVVESGRSASGERFSSSGLGDPRLQAKWRFWDRDVLGAKYAAAALLSSTIPVGDDGIGRDRPVFLAGLVNGREGLKYYYFFDIRYSYALEDDGGRPGDALFLDASYGWRPVTRGLERTDVLFFVEVNWEDRDRDTLAELGEVPSGGEFLALAAEVLISPTNRLMIRGGVQVPVSQRVPTGAPERELRFKLALEFRF